MGMSQDISGLWVHFAQDKCLLKKMQADLIHRIGTHLCCCSPAEDAGLAVEETGVSPDPGGTEDGGGHCGV